MKLINFMIKNRPRSKTHFGLVIEDWALSFELIEKESGLKMPDLKDIYRYLDRLPQSFDQALELFGIGTEMISLKQNKAMFPLTDVKLLPPVPCPAALLDFGLTPRHLINSAKTLLKHELGLIPSLLALPMVVKKIQKVSQSGIFPYYKGNHLSVIGDHDQIGWPAYSAYVDIEPELAFVIGASSGKIAGYTIFNDASARDVQFPEMTGMGPARCKDFTNSNGLGPYLVTPDEIPDPLDLKVTVNIGDRFEWTGTTSEYTARPDQVLEFYQTVFDPKPGTVIGMGTIPYCAGLDNDLWICPGDLISMTFDKIGTLHQKVPDKVPVCRTSKWAARKDILPEAIVPVD